MSAFLKSGRSNHSKLEEPSGRFRPEADITAELIPAEIANCSVQIRDRRIEFYFRQLAVRHAHCL